MKAQRKKIVEIAAKMFRDDPDIIVAYLFGSAAAGGSGPLSDFDFAVLLNMDCDHFALRLKLISELARLIKTENFDLIVINDAPLALRYGIIKGGVVLKESPSTRVALETSVVREFLDTVYIRSVHSDFVKKQMSMGVYFG